MTSTGREMAWAWQRPWTGLLSAGQHGAAGTAGLTIMPRDGLGIVSLSVSALARADLKKAVAAALSLELPAARTMVRSDRHALVWTGPDRWLLIAEHRQGFHNTLDRFAGVASVADQSDGRAVLRVSGPRARDALAKGCMIDLHPSEFPAAAAAVTSISHVDVQIWRADRADDPSAAFEIALPRSMAGSF